MERSKRFKVVAVTCAALISICGASYGKVIHVDDSAVGPGDGSSWQTAYKFLQDALADAESAEKPVEIRVAQGIYQPDRSAARPQGTGNRGLYFLLTDRLDLLGGYAGLSDPDPDARDIPLYETILSGDLLGNDAPVTDPAALRTDATRDDNSSCVVRSTQGPVRLDGCTIAGGSGVALSMGPDVEVIDCTFRGNRGFGRANPGPGAVDVWPGATGRAVLRRCSFLENGGDKGALEGYSVLVDSCHFTRNYGTGDGGGAASLSCSTITNCVFTENRVTGDGGALRLSGMSRPSHVVGCIFRGNQAQWGGALRCDGEADIRACAFVGNEGGGAGFQMGAKVRLTNCLLIGNHGGAGKYGGAWVVREYSSLEVGNCVIVGNRAVQGRFLAVNDRSDYDSVHVAVSNSVISDDGNELWSNDPSVEIAYSCIPGGAATIGVPDNWLVWGPGNIEADPCFVDPGHWDPNETPDDPSDDFFVEGDYHLKSQAGRWDPAGEKWVIDDVTSPCIDAGDPSSPVGNEPFPNGGRVNMGAYGGTAEASMSPQVGPTAGLWSEPLPLAEVNLKTAEEWSPTLSADGLTLYFGRVGGPDSSFGRIFQATRPSPVPHSLFTAVAQLPGTLNQSLFEHVLTPWVSPDGLRLYYTHQAGSVFRLMVSERQAGSTLWPTGREIRELNALGSRLHTCRLTVDELTIFFAGPDQQGAGAEYDIWMATRADRNAPFVEPVNIASLNSPANDLHATPSSDGRTLYFASRRSGRYQLFRSTRGGGDSSFGRPVHMTLFDVPNGQSMFPCLSPDGTEFYFVRETGDGRSTRDIWVSYRLD